MMWPRNMSVSPEPRSNVPWAIRLRGVAKTYRWSAPSSNPWRDLLRRLGTRVTPASSGQGFTAVQPLDLEIKAGECLGIIGRNGAGKSTLLQIIAGTLQASQGTVEVNGRVAALLELGSGFSPDFTGRENIHLNAGILGLSPAETAAKFDAIVAYSGIEEFIDQPVRTYSSGMLVRLAFAVCVHVDADILIIDEALAVGDARFSMKCFATLNQMIADGKTLIFVSHDTNAVKRLCNSALLLERGELLHQGDPNVVVNLYSKLITSPHGVAGIAADLTALRASDTTAGGDQAAQTPASTRPATMAARLPLPHDPPSSRLLVEERAHQQASDKEYTYGGERGEIISVVLSNHAGVPHLCFTSGEPARLEMVCRAHHPVEAPIYAITIKDYRGQEIFGTNTYFRNQAPPPVAPGESVRVTFDLHLNLMPGVYFISLGWVELNAGEVAVVQRRYDVLRLEMLPRDRAFGIAYCETRIEVQSGRDPGFST
jgi:lipopolysaccharide transport system ATP-binding protein